MEQQQLFEYCIIWHPTPEQAKEGRKTEIIRDVTRILAKSIEAASMAASMNIPVERKDDLDQIQVVLRPF